MLQANCPGRNVTKLVDRKNAIQKFSHDDPSNLHEVLFAQARDFSHVDVKECMKVVSADFLCSADQSREYPSSDKPEIAFAGRSNVGKSSMINALLGRKNLVRTSKTPGLTRKINFFLINESLMLVDLPGYGYASVPLEIRKKWGPMVESYLKDRSQLAGVVLIIDSRRGLTDFDKTLIHFLESKSINFIAAMSKVDKLNNSQMASQIREVKSFISPETPVVGFSSLTGFGKNELWKAIRYLIECQKK